MGPGKLRWRVVEEHGQVRKAPGREEALAGEVFEAFDGWTMVGALAVWRAWWQSERDPLRKAERSGEARVRCRLVRLRHAGIDPNPVRDRVAAERRKEEGRANERRWRPWLPGWCPVWLRGASPTCVGWGKQSASRMGKKDRVDRLAESGRAPLRGGAHTIDRVLDVRKVGRSLQVLVRWRGEYDDQWRTWEQLNMPTREEATALARRKFAPKKTKPAPGAPTRPTRDCAHLRRGQVDDPHPKKPRLRKADGQPIAVGPVPITPILLYTCPPTPQCPRPRATGGFGGVEMTVWMHNNLIL